MDIKGIVSKVWGYIPDCLGWFKAIFSEDNGNPSYTRISSACVLTNIMVNWSLCIYHNWQWIPMDAGTVAVIGLLVAGKVAQKFAEENVVRPLPMLPSPISGISSPTPVSAPPIASAPSAPSEDEEKPPRIEA